MVRLVVCVWLAAATVVGMSGVLRHLPVPPPAVAVTLTIAVLLLLRLSRGARYAVHMLGPGPLVAFHFTRIAAGGYFLVMGARGVLPRGFTTPAGWGDIIVGVAAVWVLMRCIPVQKPWQRTAFLAWNIAGLLDIFAVLINAIRFFAQDQTFVEPFMTLPLAILPTFVVPVVIVSHVMLFPWTQK